MSRVQGHYDYEDRIYKQLGIQKMFFRRYIRPRVFEIKGDRCEHCGSTDSLQIHHTSYKEVTIHTLLVLCDSCHEKAEPFADKAIYPIPSLFASEVSQ